MGCDKNYNFWLGKGSKIKLIIFAEFSANVGGGVPPIRENNWGNPETLYSNLCRVPVSILCTLFNYYIMNKQLINR